MYIGLVEVLEVSKKQGQKLVSSDELAVQFHGLRVSGSKGFKSQSCFGIPKNGLGSQKIYWDFKKCFGISKNALGS